MTYFFTHELPKWQLHIKKSPKGVICIREKLKERRASLGFKQKEVAERVGIHKAHYSKIEAGKRTPTLEIWLKIAELLQIPESELVSYMKDGMEGA